MPNEEKEALSNDIDWSEEREACDDHLKMVYEWGKEEWLGDKSADDALKELEKWEVDCDIESGKSAAREWLRRRKFKDEEYRLSLIHI